MHDSNPATPLRSIDFALLGRGRALLVLLAMVVTGACASGTDDDAGPGPMDSGPRRDSGGSDSGGSDTGPPPPDGATEDAGDEFCSGTTCEPFQYCDSGSCRDYPACRGDGTCDRPGDVCHSRHCVPGTVDIDGDGSPASDDCDETDPEIHPGHDEECNVTDDDCDMMIDEGDPAVLCESYPGGGICADGSCGCPQGTFDLDRSIPGCECVASPAPSEGVSCAAPVDLGDLADTGATMTVTGNVMPDDRVVWYRFRGVDSLDTSCDNYHVRAQFTTNPDDTFELTAYRGDCASVGCDDSGFSDYSWATDLRQTIDARLTGQCPCTAAGSPVATNVSACTDDTADYFLRVRRRTGSTLSCATYAIEISNGLYDTP